MRQIDGQDKRDGHPQDQILQAPYFPYFLMTTLVTGLVLAIFYLFGFATTFYGEGSTPWLTTSNTTAEGRLKKAATRKLNRALLDAQDLHLADLSQGDSTNAESSGHSIDRAMLNYVLKGKKHSEAGGFFWTWKLLLSGELFDTEGVWFPSRFIVFQCAQVLVGFLTAMALRVLIRYAKDEAYEAQDYLANNDVPSWAAR